MKLLVFTIILSLFVIDAYSQKNEIIKQLENNLKENPSINEQLNIHCDLADLYIQVQLSKSFEHLAAIKKILKKHKADDLFMLKFYEVYANAYFYKLKYKKALVYFDKAVKLSKKLKLSDKTDTLLFDAATAAYKSGKLSDAKNKYLYLLTSAKTRNDNEMQKQLYQHLYNISMDQKKYKDAINYLNSLLKITNKEFFINLSEANLLKKKVKVYNLELNKKNKVIVTTKNELKNTVDELNTNKIVLDSVSAENLKLIADTLQKRLKIAQMEIENQKNEAELQKKKIESEKRKQALILLSSILILILIIIIWTLILYNKIKKQNRLLEIKNRIILDKNNQIEESLNYAQTIQVAIMPDINKLSLILPESYIFFKPRDIVSGDFYWFTQRDDKILIAAVDCTGHGVPGAMLSMIGSALLNKIVLENNITSTSEILEELHKQTLKIVSKNKNSITQDGMDMAICSIDQKHKRIEFSGAKNPLYYIQNSKLHKINGTYASIGYLPLRKGKEVEFQQEIIEYFDGITLFLTTDGLADQFGIREEKQEKYNLDRLEQLFIKANSMSLKEHFELVSDEITKWKGDLPQTDDMLIIGIKLN